MTALRDKLKLPDSTLASWKFSGTPRYEEAARLIQRAEDTSNYVNNYWAWERGGQNDLPSLTCPILIQAQDLRDLLLGSETSEKAWKEEHLKLAKAVMRLAGLPDDFKEAGTDLALKVIRNLINTLGVRPGWLRYTNPDGSVSLHEQFLHKGIWIDKLVGAFNQIPGVETFSPCQGDPGEIEKDGHVAFTYESEEGLLSLCRYLRDQTKDLWDNVRVEICYTPETVQGWLRFRHENLGRLVEIVRQFQPVKNLYEEVMKLIPQTYGEAVQRFGPDRLVGRENHLWDNATTLENLEWILGEYDPKGNVAYVAQNIVEACNKHGYNPGLNKVIEKILRDSGEQSFLDLVGGYVGCEEEHPTRERVLRGLRGLLNLLRLG